MVFLRYEEALAYLQQLTKFGFNFGLGRIRELLRRMGNPHLNLRVIHIGGTNGKGSTLAMTASILQAAGYRVGTFTSPHLHSYTERFVINGEQISRSRIARLVASLRPHLDGMVAEGFEHPTEFEVSTALAFRFFFEEGVDFLVLEVGLGGSIDSTNVVPCPLVTVITNVSLDHMEYLGNSVAEIAEKKAGIIKQGVPLVTAEVDPDVLSVIFRAAREKEAPVTRVLDFPEREAKGPFPFRKVVFRGGEFSLAGQLLSVEGLREKYENLFLPLLGRHQLANAASAVAVAELLAEKGYGIGREAIYAGLAKTVWPARLEVYPGEPAVIVDGAHNHAGARSLRRALDDYFPDKGIIFVLGMLGDKEHAKVVGELIPRARAVVVTRPESPRAGGWERVAEEARRCLFAVYVVEKIEDALKMAFSLARPQDVVCVTGSLYMVAEARELIRKQKKKNTAGLEK
ncbi:MAG: bifunctional folylpolyglutamate synthase/dihydrofolate synthase [Desulfotomaculales bacterium]